MKKLIMSLFMILSFNAFALDSLPYHCQSIAVTQATVMLPAASSPSLVMIYNQSDNDLWITHPITDPSASAGWSSRLQSNHWSALALGQDAFELSCVESKPGHEQQISCAGEIMVCLWPNLTEANRKKEPYWAAENMPLRSILSTLRQHGFKIPEKPEQ